MRVAPRIPVDPRAEPAVILRPGGPFTVGITLFAFAPLLLFVQPFFPTVNDLLMQWIILPIVISIVSIPLAIWDRHALDTHGYTPSSLASPAFAIIPVAYLVRRLMTVGVGTIVPIIVWIATSVIAYLVPSSINSSDLGFLGPLLGP